VDVAVDVAEGDHSGHDHDHDYDHEPWIISIKTFPPRHA
jgi:hypothetical protein